MVGVEIGEFFDLGEIALMQDFVIIALCEIAFEFNSLIWVKEDLSNR